MCSLETSPQTVRRDIPSSNCADLASLLERTPKLRDLSLRTGEKTAIEAITAQAAHVLHTLTLRRHARLQPAWCPRLRSLLLPARLRLLPGEHLTSWREFCTQLTKLGITRVNDEDMLWLARCTLLTRFDLLLPYMSHFDGKLVLPQLTHLSISNMAHGSAPMGEALATLKGIQCFLNLNRQLRILQFPLPIYTEPVYALLAAILAQAASNGVEHVTLRVRRQNIHTDDLRLLKQACRKHTWLLAVIEKEE